MKKWVALLLLMPALAVAKSPFDGTWKTRPDSIQVTGKPDVYDLSNGVYDCSSCVPPFKIKADGTFQPVPDHDYTDQEAVKITGPASIEITDKKAGKLMSTSSLTVSPDGSKLTGKFTGYMGEKPFSQSFTAKRVGPGAAGAHPISGSWQQDTVADMSDTGTMVTLESTPGGLKMTWNGQTTDAKFDGKEYPQVGDPGKTMVSLKKLSDTQIEETDRRRGKVFDVIVYTVAADGKTMHVVDTDPQHGTKTSYVMVRQP